MMTVYIFSIHHDVRLVRGLSAGWFALFGVSDYRKFSVCLPFEIGDAVSLSKYRLETII